MPEPIKPPSRDWENALREAAPYLGLGTSLALTVLAGLGLGYWVDARLGTSPAFILAGAVFGLVAAGIQFIRAVSRKP